MKVASTPLRSMLSRVSVEYCEESLAPNTSKVDDERMCIFHRASGALVLGDANLVRGIFGGMAVEDLFSAIACVGGTGHG